MRDVGLLKPRSPGVANCRIRMQQSTIQKSHPLRDRHGQLATERLGVNTLFVGGFAWYNNDAMAVQGRSSVVIDCGSCYTKAGFAGEVRPQVFRPTAGAERSEAGAPVRHGIVQDWDALERLCIDVYYKCACGGSMAMQRMRGRVCGWVKTWDSK